VTENWKVDFSTSASKQYWKLKKSGQRPPITDTIQFLLEELRLKGPERFDWPNYSKLSENKYHCHLKKGKPTYVACWEVLDRKTNK
jgi:mRNA-degrading endonuclease RelE of RelBE toxin-antitoxin system